jgi:hypothetical protein
MSTWIDVNVKASPLRSLNVYKGIIRCRDLRACVVEILDALRPEGVINVEYILSNKTGMKQPTNTFFLTFTKPSAPNFLKAAYSKIPVEMFISNPLRCFKCQRNSCKEQPQCANCSGLLPAFSKDCPGWIKQRELMKIKTERCTSFGEAKQLYEQQFQCSSAACSASSRRPGTSCATVAKPTRCISTQTELTWPVYSTSPVEKKQYCQRKCQVTDIK